MKKFQISIFAIASLVLASCGGKSDNKGSLVDGASGDMQAYLESDVNGIQQALPQIMLMPADQTLQFFGMLKERNLDGKIAIERDYKTYLLKDDRFPRIASFVQDAFNKQSFPLADFEQTLKQLDTQAAMDMADGIRQDAKTMLLQTAQPDIILELNYYNSSNSSLSLTSHNYKRDAVKNISYTLTALDAYTNKSVASITTSNMKAESTTEAIQEDMGEKLPGFMKDIQNYFSDILTRGREVTVRIVVESGSNVNLQDESIEGDTYSDWMVDFIKAKSVKGACKMQRNTNNELYFVNVRIPLHQADGSQYGVYDFTRDLQKSLRKSLGLQSINNSQGLGEVVLMVKGL